MDRAWETSHTVTTVTDLCFMVVSCWTFLQCIKGCRHSSICKNKDTHEHREHRRVLQVRALMLCLSILHGRRVLWATFTFYIILMNPAFLESGLMCTHKAECAHQQPFNGWLFCPQGPMFRHLWPDNPALDPLVCNHAGSVPLFEHVILELHSLELFLSSSLISVFNMKIRADLWHLIREVGMKCIAVAKLLIEAN